MRNYEITNIINGKEFKAKLLIELMNEVKICLTNKLAKLLKPANELASVNANRSLIPPSSANNAASENVLVSQLDTVSRWH